MTDPNSQDAATMERLARLFSVSMFGKMVA
jgi:hypothetical protein